jgi:molybdenum cofactor cytidylyltransferase
METLRSNSFVFIRQNKSNLPSRGEAETILNSTHDKHTKVYAHSKAVAKLAILLAEKLSNSGIELNLDLVYASGLLHDLAKGKSNHAIVAGKMLRKMGYLPVAEIVEKHVDIYLPKEIQIDEAAVVYLADKLLKTDKLVSLEERYRPGIERFRHDLEIRRSIKIKLDNAKTIKNQIEKEIGLKIHLFLKKQGWIPVV